jgi:hypothetical protein
MSVIIVAKRTDFVRGPEQVVSAVDVADSREDAEEKVEQLARRDGGDAQYHLVDAVEVIPIVEVQEL